MFRFTKPMGINIVSVIIEASLLIARCELVAARCERVAARCDLVAARCELVAPVIGCIVSARELHRQLTARGRVTIVS